MKPEYRVTIILPNSNKLEDTKEPYEWQLHSHELVTWVPIAKGKASSKEEAFEKAVLAYDSIEL